MARFPGFCIIIATIGMLLVIRLVYCIVFKTKPLITAANKQLCTMVVLGSGGHTAEMLTTIKKLNFTIYKPLHYVAAKTDSHSLQRARNNHANTDIINHMHLHSIYRSREVHQSWISTIFTTLYSLMESFVLILRTKPDVIICNGPGTCIPILLSGLLLRVLFIKTNIKLIFLESFCRVDDLSMSGKISYRFVNLFIVQWPHLAYKYPKAKYIGRIF